MVIVQVHARVKTDLIDAFKAATAVNAAESLKEPGVARFDVAQQIDDPSRFTLIEVYRDAGAVAAHKDTPHYQTWRNAVASMMVEPRTSVKFTGVFPDDSRW
jgi:autoinducer 2-degrading protein